MKIVVDFGCDADIIDCPEQIIDDLDNLRNRFIDWLFDEKNDHSYWMYENGEKHGCCYRSEAFIEWLNKYILTDSEYKVELIESAVLSWDKSLPKTGF